MGGNVLCKNLRYRGFNFASNVYFNFMSITCVSLAQVVRNAGMARVSDARHSTNTHWKSPQGFGET